MYRMTVKGVNFDYAHLVDITGDNTQYSISNLPDPEGSGRQYLVGITYSVVTQKEVEVHGTPVEAMFATIPYQPDSMRITNPIMMEFCWTKSPTPHVSAYRVRWQSMEEVPQAQEETVPVAEDYVYDDVKFSLPHTLLKTGVVYKVSVIAVVHDGDGNDVVVLESNELNEKFIIMTAQGLGRRLEVYDEELHQLNLSML
jgi:hypothetical protein